MANFGTRVKVGELLRLIKHSLREVHNIETIYVCETLKGTTNLIKAGYYTGGKNQYLLGEIVVNSRNLTEENMPYIALECLKILFFNDQNVFDLTPNQILFLSSLGTDYKKAMSRTSVITDEILNLGEMGLIDVEDSDRHGQEWKAILTKNGVDALAWLEQVKL